MLSLFRNQQPFSLLILLVILVATRLPFLATGFGDAEAPYLGISVGSYTLSVFLAMLLSFAQAVWINTIFSNGQFMEEKTVVPALIWILLTSMDKGFLLIGFPLLSTTILLMVLHIFIHVPANIISRQQCFHIGLLAGIIILMHPPFIVFLPFLLAIIYNMNTLGLREYFVFVLGILMIIFWVWSYAFITDQSLLWINRLVDQFGVPFHKINLYEGITWVIIGSFCIGGFVGLFTLMRSASAKRKKNVRTLLVFTLGIILTFLFSANWDFSNILMVLMPLSFLISISLLIIHKIKIAEVLFGIFVLTILGSILLRLLDVF